MNLLTTSPAYRGIQFFDEAKRFYKDQMPPFLHIIRSLRDRKREVELATESGYQRVPPMLVELVAARWCSNYSFWTLNVNGIRHIVKCFAE